MTRPGIPRRTRISEGPNDPSKAPASVRWALALNLTVILLISILAAAVSVGQPPAAHSAAARPAQRRATNSVATASPTPPAAVPSGTFGSYEYSAPAGLHMTYYL